MKVQIINTETININDVPPFVRNHYSVLKKLQSENSDLTGVLQVGETLGGSYFYYDITDNVGNVIEGVQTQFVKELK